MPYEVRRSVLCPSSRPHGVFREGEQGGQPLGCHESEQSAHKQIAAIEKAEEQRKGSS